jgi:hypothetical protein
MPKVYNGFVKNKGEPTRAVRLETFEICITSLVIMVKKENQLEVQGQGTALSLTDDPSFPFSLDKFPPVE